MALTSTQSSEGKTTSACNLAMVLALGGARVLLIDGDMRRPNLHKLLGLKNSVGLSDLLAGQVRPSQTIQRTQDPNLFALTAGQPPPNPSELLSSPWMRTLLTSLESGCFDRVIIDSPPVLAATDAVVLSEMGAAVIFVIGAERTRTGHARHAVEMLQASGNSSVTMDLRGFGDSEGEGMSGGFPKLLQKSSRDLDMAYAYLVSQGTSTAGVSRRIKVRRIDGSAWRPTRAS